MTEQSAFIQAEFFLVGKDAKSLDELLSQIRERLEIDAGIKLVVRFPDQDGALTKGILAASAEVRNYNRLFHSMSDAKGLKRIILAWKADRSAR